MGKLSCSVPLGLTTLTFSSFFGLLSLGSRVWVIGDVDIDIPGSNTTEHHEAILGLWEYCVDEDCGSIFSAGGIDTAWLFAAAILQVITETSTLLSLAAFWAVNIFEPYRKSLTVGLAALISCLVAEGCLFGSLVLVGHNVSFPSFIPAQLEAHLGWAYYIAVVDSLGLAVSSVNLGRFVYVIKNMPILYEDITDPF